MTSGLALDCQLSVKGLPITNQPRLVYLLVETGADAQPAVSAPVNLGLVVDVSLSMRIRLVTDEEFEILAQMGYIEEIMVDGIPAWSAENIPAHVIVGASYICVRDAVAD